MPPNRAPYHRDPIAIEGVPQRRECAAFNWSRGPLRQRSVRRKHALAKGASVIQKGVFLRNGSPDARISHKISVSRLQSCNGQSLERVAKQKLRPNRHNMSIFFLCQKSCSRGVRDNLVTFSDILLTFVHSSLSLLFSVNFSVDFAHLLRWQVEICQCNWFSRLNIWPTNGPKLGSTRLLCWFDGRLCLVDVEISTTRLTTIKLLSITYKTKSEKKNNLLWSRFDYIKIYFLRIFLLLWGGPVTYVVMGLHQLHEKITEELDFVNHKVSVVFSVIFAGCETETSPSIQYTCIHGWWTQFGW